MKGIYQINNIIPSMLYAMIYSNMKHQELIFSVLNEMVLYHNKSDIISFLHTSFLEKHKNNLI